MILCHHYHLNTDQNLILIFVRFSFGITRALIILVIRSLFITFIVKFITIVIIKIPVTLMKVKLLVCTERLIIDFCLSSVIKLHYLKVDCTRFCYFKIFMVKYSDQHYFYLGIN